MADASTWLERIAKYEKEFQKWEKRSADIIKRYRDDDYKSRKTAAFNILWSNVQTLIPAVFARLPRPDVSRRFKDSDPVGRVAGMILERALDYEIQHYSDYRDSLGQCVLDRFLGGRGTSWVRYEPHIRAEQVGMVDDGDQITEDAEAEAEPETRETLDYECAPCDYVHWRDFGHTQARTWEELTAVWRRVYMTRAACVERFGKAGEKIPLDSRPDEKKGEGERPDALALIYEIWDKDGKKAYWLSKSLGEFVDEKDDPLGLEGFFPCPRPLYATLTNESLVPVPDYALYQDQARSLDLLAERIDGLIRMLQVKGVRNAAFPGLERLFNEANNGDLIPVNEWAAFSEKNGLKGAIDLVDLTPIASALASCYEATKAQLDVIYNVTGIADIIRGQSAASETATAQQIKGQYAGLRLNSMKNAVSQFATELLQIKAQIMCGKFDPQTLLKISAADQLSEQDKTLIPQALQLLSENPLRSFRIEVAADSLVMMDEQQEREDRTQFVTAIGTLLKEAQPVVMQAPAIAPLVLELIKFSAGAFKVGRGLEGLIDQTAEELKQAQQAKQGQPPPPDPEMIKLQAQQQSEQARLQHEAQLEQMRQQAESQKMQMAAQLKQQEQQLQAQADAVRNHMEEARAAQDREHQAAIEQYKAQLAQESEARKLEFERWKVERQEATKVEVAEMSASVTLSGQQQIAADRAADGKTPEFAQTVSENVAKLHQRLDEVKKLATAKRVLIRDANGRPIASQIEGM